MALRKSNHIGRVMAVPSRVAKCIMRLNSTSQLIAVAPKGDTLSSRAQHTSLGLINSIASVLETGIDELNRLCLIGVGRSHAARVAATPVPRWKRKRSEISSCCQLATPTVMRRSSKFPIVVEHALSRRPAYVLVLALITWSRVTDLCCSHPSNAHPTHSDVAQARSRVPRA